MLSKEEKFFSIKKSANFHPDNMSPILIIPDRQLKFITELGSDAFGKVFLGYWKTKDPNSKTNEEIRCISLLIILYNILLYILYKYINS